jgi:hypothetical protein
MKLKRVVVDFESGTTQAVLSETTQTSFGERSVDGVFNIPGVDLIDVAAATAKIQAVAAVIPPAPAAPSAPDIVFAAPPAAAPVAAAPAV